MDSKLLATIIAIAKKEASANSVDISNLQGKVESQLKEFHSRSPILETPEFFVKNGCLHCQWQSGLTLDFGNIVGPQGPQGIQGIQGVTGQDGPAGKDGYNGKDGRDGVDGKAAAAGRDGVDGPQGPQGASGVPGEPGEQGVPGKDGKDAERGSTGLSGPKGLDGDDGEDGVGIEKAYVDDNYHLTIKLTSGKVIDAGYVRGKTGASSGKGGRVTGGYTGGGSGSNFFVNNAEYNSNGDLVLTMSNGSTVTAASQNTPTNIVYVSTASQLSGVLLSTKVYFLDGQIDMAGVSIIVPELGLTLAGHGFGVSGLVSSDNNHTMFVAGAGTFSGDLFLTSLDITCTGTGSQVFDLDNQENFDAVELNTVNFLGCTNLGELANYRQGLGRNVAWISCADGLTMTGAWSGGFAILDSIYVGAPMSASGVLFRAGAGLTIGGSFRANVNILSLGSLGATFCDFAPANITLDAGFWLDGVRAKHGNDPVPNMPASNVRALIKNCVGIDNTYQGAAHTPTGSSLITITTVDTLYQITGAQTIEHAHWFSTANTNGLKLDSEHHTHVTVSGTLSFSGSNGRVMGVQIRLYDSSAAAYVNVGPEYQATLNGGGGGLKAEGVTFSGVVEMATDDRVEIWVVNRTDNSDITVLGGGQFQVSER